MVPGSTACESRQFWTSPAGHVRDRAERGFRMQAQPYWRRSCRWTNPQKPGPSSSRSGNPVPALSGALLPAGPPYWTPTACHPQHPTGELCCGRPWPVPGPERLQAPVSCSLGRCWRAPSWGAVGLRPVPLRVPPARASPRGRGACFALRARGEGPACRATAGGSKEGGGPCSSEWRPCSPSLLGAGAAQSLLTVAFATFCSQDGQLLRR